MKHRARNAESPVQTRGLLIRWAPFYDTVVDILTLGKSSRLRELTIDQALLKQGESLLDVGCGTGGVAIPARKHVGTNGRVSGIDPSPEMIAVARRKAAGSGLDVEFRLGVIESLPYPDATFDAVTSSLMMHHLSEELQVRGLKEIYRVLKPGGRVVIVDTKRPRGSIGRKIIALLERHHGTKFGFEELLEKLKAAGFTSVHEPDARFATFGFVRAAKPIAHS